MQRSIKEQLNDLRKDSDLNPTKEWVNSNRAALLSKIKSGSKTETVENKLLIKYHEAFLSLFPAPVYRAARSFAVLLLVVGVATGGWMGSVSAAEASLPGDLLYGVKLANERTQVAVAKVTGNKEAEANLSMDFATKRAKEIKEVVDKKPEQVEKTAKKLKKNVESAQVALRDLGESDPEAAVELAKEVTKKTGIISNEIKEAVKQTKNKSKASSDEDNEEKNDEGSTSSTDAAPDANLATSTPENADDASINSEGSSTTTKSAVQDKQGVDLEKNLAETTKLLKEVEFEAVEVVINLEDDENQKKEFIEEFVEGKIGKILDESKDTLEDIESVEEKAASKSKEKEEAVAAEKVSQSERGESNSPSEDEAEQAAEQADAKEKEELQNTLNNAKGKVEETKALVESVAKEVGEELLNSEELKKKLDILKEADLKQEETQKVVITLREGLINDTGEQNQNENQTTSEGLTYDSAEYHLEEGSEEELVEQKDGEEQTNSASTTLQIKDADET